MMPPSPPINKKENDCQCSDHNPLTDKIYNPSNSNFCCLALRICLFVLFWLRCCVPFHLDFVHEEPKPKAATLCPAAALPAAMITDFYLINFLMF